jgi:hypothetical protein
MRWFKIRKAHIPARSIPAASGIQESTRGSPSFDFSLSDIARLRTGDPHGTECRATGVPAFGGQPSPAR